MVAVIAWLEVCIESLLKSSGNIVVIKSEWKSNCFAELGGRGRVAGIGFGVDDAFDPGENAGADLRVGSSDIDFQVCLLGDDVFLRHLREWDPRLQKLVTVSWRAG